MRWIVLLLALCATSPAAALFDAPGDWNAATRLLLAQSCVAEAGFDSSTSLECAAIGYVYVKRVRQMRRMGREISLLEMVRRYSQPIRYRRHLWQMTLNPELTRPRGWPRRWPDWETHFRHKWAAMLEAVDQWAAGEVRDPCPRAVHFGAVTDIPGPRMVRVRCAVRTRNRFYRVRP